MSWLPTPALAGLGFPSSNSDFSGTYNPYWLKVILKLLICSGFGVIFLAFGVALGSTGLLCLDRLVAEPGIVLGVVGLGGSFDWLVFRTIDGVLDFWPWDSF